MASIASDIRKTAWGPTLTLNLMRAAAAGVVFGCFGIAAVLSAGDANSNTAEGVRAMVMFPLMMPLLYLIFLLPLGLLSIGLNRMGVPWVGLFSVFVSVIMVAGDPLVWMTNRVIPGGLPVVRSIHFRFVNFVLVLLVYKASDAGLCRSCGCGVSTMADNCPHCGEPDPWERAAATSGSIREEAIS